MMMELGGSLKDYTTHLLMILSALVLAIFVVFLQSLISGGNVSSVVILFYEHLVSTLFLSTLAFIFESRKRPPITLKVFLWANLVGFLQVPTYQLLVTSSLKYVSASFQTTVMNTGSVVTFLMAVIVGREALSFCTINGQAKVWGIILSLTGAIIMVLWSGPKASSQHKASNTVERLTGCLMVIVSVLGGSSSSILLEHATIMYPAELSLSALLSFCGTLQTAIIAGLTERSASAWKINLHGSYMLPVILYGGLVIYGLSYYVHTWAVHKKGPVYTSAFSPLLIVFTFLLEAVVLGKDVYFGSILGAIFVIVGLYVLLWGKAKEKEEKLHANSVLGIYEPLIYEPLC